MLVVILNKMVRRDLNLVEKEKCKVIQSSMKVIFYDFKSLAPFLNLVSRSMCFKFKWALRLSVLSTFEICAIMDVFSQIQSIIGKPPYNRFDIVLHVYDNG